jgi:penicillin-binding protein 1C
MKARRILIPAAALFASLLLWPVTIPERPVRTTILDRNQTPLYTTVRAASNIHPEDDSLLVSALVSVEDQRFFRHPGIDPMALARAARDNFRAGRTVSGASTLSMQAARLIGGPTGRGLVDKLLQMVLAVRLEVWHSKKEILAIWLDRAYFGRGAYGAVAAADIWFGKRPDDLSLAEAAYLIGLPQRPERTAVDRKRRQKAVLSAMVSSGALSEADAADAAALELSFAAPRTRPLLAPHVSIRLAGRSQDEIVTTIDARLQRRVESLARAHVDQLADQDVGNVAALVVDNGSGAILAYLGSADYFDNRSAGANDGVRMLRQPGSALKPFIYGTAFDRGFITPTSILQDVETPFVEAGAAFSAENYDRRYHGPVTARRALASSYNIPAVTLVDKMGPHRALEALRRAGFQSLTQSAEFYGVGLALGNGEVSLLELARAYAGLALGGRPPDVHLIEGEPLLKSAPGAFSEEASRDVLDILSDAEARSPAFGRGGPLEMPFPMAAKTGTSKDYRDNWAIGVTPAHTIAVWAGNFDGAPMKNISGVSGAGTLLHAIALELGGSGGFPGSTSPSQAENRHAATRPATPDSRLTMRYPADGMVYQLDPILRPEHQRIRLQADVPATWSNVRFLVNGQAFEGEYLVLEPAVRTIAVMAMDQEGMDRRSLPHYVRVLPTPPSIDP